MRKDEKVNNNGRYTGGRVDKKRVLVLVLVERKEAVMKEVGSIE